MINNNFEIQEGVAEYDSDLQDKREVLAAQEKLKNIVIIDERPHEEEVLRYIISSKLTVEDLLIQNAQNELSNEDITELFELADSYKNNGNYEMANEIFGILLDFSIHNQSSGIERVYETQGIYEDTLQADYNYYYDLGVLIFEGKYLNIPLPLLSKDAVKMFFAEGVSIKYKEDHRRQISENPEGLQALDKEYKTINPNKAPWLLVNDKNNDSHETLKDLM